MDFKSSSSQSSIATIQSIGKDWGSLRQHDEPLYVKKNKEKRKEHRDEQKPLAKTNVAVQKVETPEKKHEKSNEKSDSTGFEIVI
jgi:hypothetical protein